MMICSADFEELFSDLFRPRAQANRAAESSAQCLARWEQDRGRVAPTDPDHRPENGSASRIRPAQAKAMRGVAGRLPRERSLLTCASAA